ncbi:hypothetical protein HFO39_20590 [Rhizobium leguminosarum]|nr:hypothetical protein [Rhizobium leguminosarum]MBY5521526.1 hypothetical protein [Rhizobium leguminosarum]MBY5549313.1 hypothetical protein [Rhizobium leguminosarum]MBY5586415.1 hypothetical protein [Rhizobium leguminosarum]MBY5637136.1 hypothetical protein [Rhizobium leguminosarum]
MMRMLSGPKVTQTIKVAIAAATASMLMAGAAKADESAFLKTLAGNWSGKGTVKVRTNAPTMKVTCRFKSDANASSLALNGRCTSLAIFSRVISASLKASGDTYTGSYVGAGTGTAGLGGKRAGNAISLAIKWAKEVNGDRRAQMTIEKTGASGMRLTTIDTDPATGRSVVTSRIELRRS